MYSVGFNGKKVSTALQVVLITLLVGLFTAGIGAAETHITALPYDITSPGYYVLDTGCTNVGWDYAINIASSDVVLDGNGYVLDGDDSGTLSNQKWAVSVGDVSNVTILNITVLDWYCAIQCKNITGGTLMNNNLSSNNGEGIYVYNSSNILIINNNISNNGEGIYVYNSNNNQIRENTIDLNLYGGIKLHSSAHNTIVNNTFEDNLNGVYLESSSMNNIVTDNDFAWDGLFILDSYQNSVSDNTINGKELIYIENESNLSISDTTNVGQIILVKCDNIIIKNLNISGTSVGIEMIMTSGCVIKNNTASNNTYGIYLESSENNVIFLNEFVDNIYNVYTNNSTDIWNSTIPITYTYNGVNYTRYLGNYYSDYTGTDADGDGIGDIPYGNDAYPLMESLNAYIILSSGMVVHITALPYDITSPGYYVLDTGCTNVGWDYAINIASSDVVLDGNGYVLDGDDSGTPVKKKYGILVKGVDNVIILNVEVTDWVAGIYLNSVRAGEVVNCNLNSNSYAGIYLYESSKNKLNNNIIRSNTYGIRLESSCSNNIIFLNNFEDNTFNIRDKGSNRWYSLEPLSYTYNGVNYTRYLGNYYSDYTGTDADGDGIGDIPYGNDAYPLMESPASQESTIEEGVASNVARSVISEVSQKLPAFQLHLALLGLLVATYILRKCRR